MKARFVAATAGAVVAVALAAALLIRGCHPTPRVDVPPVPVVHAVQASSSATVAGSQTVRVILHHRSPKASGSLAPRSNLGDGLSSSDDWDVVVEATQSLVATASSSAQATSSLPPPVAVAQGSSEAPHGRLGVLVGPFPGVVAVDVEVARVDVPRWLVGMPLELGLDVEGNTRQVGAGLSLGNKAFVEVGGFSEWSLANQGIYAGVGLRF